MSDLKFNIIKNIAVIGENSKGWRKEVNIVSWNERRPKLDIRDWDDNHEKMSKGLTFNKEETCELKKAFESLDVEALG